MKKYIYHSNKVRCSIEYNKRHDKYILQIQERVFFIFWINMFGKWMAVSEGFWGESDKKQVLKLTYQFGNTHEAWATGSLNIEERSESFLKEYVLEKNKITLKCELFSK